MHVAVDLNLNWFLQFIITTFVVGLGFGLLRFFKNTASRFFLFEDPVNHNSSSSCCSSSSSSNTTSFSNSKSFDMAADAAEPCAVCGKLTKKRCSRCKIISYCSEACQRSHWISEHKAKCNNLKLISKANSKQSTPTRHRSSGTSDIVHHSGKILFPYDEFVELFDWESPGFPPCGLLNCGNSCFANVVLQCLAYTKPLVAYLLIKGHRRECRRNDWCFLCEFQSHLERASQSVHPFSPINILSRLPNIGGNLGHGSQEDSHEFMRFAIDTMQSVCLDQFGGEKAVHPRSQETTLIQHIFGGQLQSQVICTKCNTISNQLENMMDLTVEIQGDVASLEECLDQFTVKESLHGENMYKCDRCNEYVTAWKRLSVRLPPNILTIALKRFQSGRFGKLNKRVTFPEKLDLGPYMCKEGADNDIYELYAVIVHVDMLNASFFGHYICYVKDFRGQWYRIDDCKVARVDLDDVLSQGAYMLLYSRARVRPTCMNPLVESNGPEIKKGIEHNEEPSPSIEQSDVECPSVVPENLDAVGDSDSSAVMMTVSDDRANILEVVMENMDNVDPGTTSFVKKDVGVGVSDEGSSTANNITIAPSENSNVVLLSSGDTSLSCKSEEEGGIVKVLDTIPISDVDENKLEGDRCNGSMKDTSLTIARGKSEATSDKPCIREQLTSSRGTPEVARKCNGTDNSGLKLKPIFSPGFLSVKQQQKKFVKRTAGVLNKQQEPAPSGLCCSTSNGFANAKMNTMNNSFTEEENSNGHTEISSNKVSRDTNMIDVNFTDQEAADSASDAPNRIIGVNMSAVEQFVEDKPDSGSSSTYIQAN